MKYFTDEWFASKKPCKTSNKYYEYMRKNYEYYPDWFKKYDVVNNGMFIFHDSLIDELIYDNDDIVVSMVGIADSGVRNSFYPYNKSFNLIFKNAEIIEIPDIVEGRDVLAEEIYCSSNGTEFHMLLTDDDIDYTMNLTVKCSDMLIEYESLPLMFQLKMKFNNFINGLSKRNRIKKKAKRINNTNTI